MTNQNDGWIPAWLKEGVAPFLAILVVVGGFATIWYVPTAKTEMCVMMTLVLSFFFGSSKSSQTKDEVIGSQLAAKDDTIKEQLDKK